MFNEITKNAIQKAFEKPLAVNLHLVDAQQARRVLDRLVGYKISPLLWDKVRRGLSAGRVQTVALRLIVDREREIRAFIKQGILDASTSTWPPRSRRSSRRTWPRRTTRTSRSPNEAAAQAIVAALDGVDYVVRSVTNREKRRNPVPPFITSTLQQEAARKLRFSVKRTMMLAQKLYEGVELGKEEGAVGLITYMRTDSTRVSNDALDEVRGMIDGALWRGVSSRDAQRLQEQEGRAGRARSDSSDLGAAHAGERREVPGRRRTEAVPADLDALCRVADDAGGVRSDHHRRRRQGQGRRDVSVPRHRQRAEVRRLPEGLRRRQGRRRTKTTKS